LGGATFVAIAVIRLPMAGVVCGLGAVAIGGAWWRLRGTSV
jgi:uncharacterized protein YdgA (DUF945 family)